MNATHQAMFANRPDVVAWQFSVQEVMPTWVSRVFTYDGRELNWSGRAKDKTTVTAIIGSWAVKLNGSIIVLTHEEFTDLFTPL